MAARTWRIWLPDRPGTILALTDENGRVGQGEASPLPGLSPDRLEDDERALAALARALPRTIDGPDEILREIAPTSPAARFAVETAVLDLEAQRQGASNHAEAAVIGAAAPPIEQEDASMSAANRNERRRIHSAGASGGSGGAGGPPGVKTRRPPDCRPEVDVPRPSVPRSLLLRGAACEEVVEAAISAVARGYRTLKRKVGGRSFGDEIAVLRAVRVAVGPGIELRVDANGAWGLTEARANLEALAVVGVSLVEEPVGGELLLSLGRTATPWAADESLARPGLAERLAPEPGCAAFVLKPMLLGGAARCLDLAGIAREYGKAVIVTHLFDGPVAVAACEALARRIPGRLLACGLEASHLEPIGRRSLVRRSAGSGDDPLSFLAAARSAAARPALVAEGRTWTYGDLVADVRAACRRIRGRRRVVVVAEARRETVVTIWAALELGIPFVPLHPRLTEAERLALISRLDANPESASEAAILFTSGTTGEPKGVVLRRDNLIASAKASAQDLGDRPDDVWLLCMPLAHVGGLSILTRSLAARRAFVLLPRFDPGEVLRAIRSHHVTLVSVVPTMLSALCDADVDGTLRRPRAILVGGDAAPRRLLDRCRAERLPVLVTYGLTEASSQVATQAPGEPVGVDEGAGLPLEGVQVRIVDGRIEVRGPTVMAGYLGEPPLGPEDWLDTGDVGHLDDRGRLHIASRRSDLIVTGGENVSPIEVERALESLPSVRAAFVHGVPDERWGEVVAALLVPEGLAPSDAELTAQMAQVLAPHKRPRQIRWVESLPVGSSGKIVRRAGIFAPDGAVDSARRPIRVDAEPHTETAEVQRIEVHSRCRAGVQGGRAPG